jgi:diguanylate cyclase (GGDEF)-like protein/PAS domain S-box-containing protein
MTMPPSWEQRELEDTRVDVAATILAALQRRSDTVVVLVDEKGLLVETLAWPGDSPVPGRHLQDFLADGDHSNLLRVLESGEGSCVVSLVPSRASVSLLCTTTAAGTRVVVGQDVTPLRQRLDSAECRFKQLVEDSPMPFLIHVDGRIVFGSTAGVRLMAGTTLDDFVGRSILDFLHPDSVEPTLERVARVLRLGVPSEASEAKVVRLDGVVIDVESVACPIDFGDKVGVQTVLWDVTERKRIQERLGHQAGHDHLTGLANRVRLEEAFATASSRLDRGRTAALAVVLVDLDGFKAINDTWGHGVGDDLLRAVADRLREELRPSDTVARFGGDEFAVVSEIEDSSQASALENRIRAAITRPFSTGDRSTIRIAASIGVACITTPDSLANVLNAADRALYADKRQRSRARPPGAGL